MLCKIVFDFCLKSSCEHNELVGFVFRNGTGPVVFKSVSLHAA